MPVSLWRLHRPLLGLKPASVSRPKKSLTSAHEGHRWRQGIAFSTTLAHFPVVSVLVWLHHVMIYSIRPVSSSRLSAGHRLETAVQELLYGRYTIAGATAAAASTTTTFHGSRIRLKKLIVFNFVMKMGRDFVVGTVTLYGLDCPGIKSRWRRDFPHLSKPAPGPTEPPTKWVPGLSRGLNRPGRGVDHSPPSSAEVKEGIKLYLFSTSGPSWPVLG